MTIKTVEPINISQQGELAPNYVGNDLPRTPYRLLDLVDVSRADGTYQDKYPGILVTDEDGQGMSVVKQVIDTYSLQSDQIEGSGSFNVGSPINITQSGVYRVYYNLGYEHTSMTGVKFSYNNTETIWEVESTLPLRQKETAYASTIIELQDGDVLQLECEATGSGDITILSDRSQWGISFINISK